VSVSDSGSVSTVDSYMTAGDSQAASVSLGPAARHPVEASDLSSGSMAQLQRQVPLPDHRQTFLNTSSLFTSGCKLLGLN